VVIGGGLGPAHEETLLDALAVLAFVPATADGGRPSAPLELPRDGSSLLFLKLPWQSPPEDLDAVLELPPAPPTAQAPVVRPGFGQGVQP
jgi:hypothetical protein